ncbi:MAG: tryptophanase [Myxococcales bacterium]|nr:tryptophanase [Myxococcales bacterium]MCB9576743.1 tryptophanase [Polyangiaceae bacterium]
MSDEPFRTIIEPFRIKAVEPIPITTEGERSALLEKAGYNLFKLPATKVTIDLLTDSGTGAMSDKQWASLLSGDESYAGSRSYERFEHIVKELTGYSHVFPTHQGRAAERILFEAIVRDGDVIPNNTHFDTTRANLEHRGGVALDIPVVSEPGFGGNMDLTALERALRGNQRIPLVMMTLTNNAAGGQPVSLANTRAVRALCDRYNVPLFLDAARFAENAWLVKRREEGQHGRSPEEIAKEMFRLADGCTISAKKDGIVNIGGILATNRDDWAQLFEELEILTEGFPTYGGLAGRDLEAMAVGLMEALDPDYLKYREATIAYLARGFRAAGLPIVEPPGGHAVFVDAARALPHIPPAELPGQALAVELFREGGVRSVEIGTLMFADAARMELVRLALPRRVYTASHVDWVIETAERVAARLADIRGYRIVQEPPMLRHFSARLAPV